MKTYPKITIVTQCFNRQETISDTIESILSQGYPNLEYIVIDDSSMDKSWDIIQKYKGKVTYMERLGGQRKNPIYALNYGFSKATGDILTWINAKNILMPRSLFTIAEVFTSFKEIEWVTGMGTTIDGQGKIVYVGGSNYDFYDYLSPRGSAVIQQESTFFTRSLWEKAGGKFNERYTNAFDVCLWCEHFFPRAKLYHIDTIIGAYRKSPHSLSIKYGKEFADFETLARKKMSELVPPKELFHAKVYRALKFFRPLLRNIPDDAFSKIPLLKRYSHIHLKFRTIENDSGVLMKYLKNPFRHFDR